MAIDHLLDSYLNGANALFIEELFERYQQDPASVSDEWKALFEELGDVAQPSASWNQLDTGIIGRVDPEEVAEAAAKAAKAGKGKGAKPAMDKTQLVDTVRAFAMIHAYRTRGHLAAHLDPLDLEDRKPHAELDPATYGFTADRMDAEVYLDGTFGLEKASVGEVLAILRQTYCSKIGFETMHIQYPEQKDWLRDRIEAMRGKPTLSADEKKTILKDMVEVDSFEEFLQVKYPGMKRFSIQGGDAAIAGLEAILHRSAELGVEEIVIGMPHRGRMNVLTQIMGKPYAELLSLFHGNLDFPEDVKTSGDVKYHLGASHDREFAGGKKVHLSLTANPSHLEVVNPVVCGKVRAKQDQKEDETRLKVMGLTLHGDAAFSGQGSVPETLSLSELKGYRTGGTVHVIVNNQIGFTTAPRFSRFTPYPSDVAKMVQAPIFHVNGEDPEAVIAVCRLASEFRQEFGRDVVVDVICYRKYGHNESDEPMFTQPKMYQRIAKKKAPALVYADQLLAEKSIDQAHLDGLYAEYKARFEKDFDSGKNYKPNKADWLEGKWSGKKSSISGKVVPPKTGVSKKVLEKVVEGITKVPEAFNVNRKIARQLKAKQEMMKSGTGIDWGLGEALAFGSLLEEGYPVRLSGQDSERGTFSHRHSVLTDQVDEKKYTPLNHISDKQAHYEVINSSLSELAILGFEYGYSQAEPDALVMWEAQFGDFANGAQMMIDQFITSGEIKWLRMSGLVMLLPHGYEGQGPEHSSARLERFLQMCAEENMRVCNCTTPANLFHALRRQMISPVRKPLVLMTPKSLLRHKLCVSDISEFTGESRFRRVLPEIDDKELVADKDIKRVIFTSGKVYYDLLEKRRTKKQKDVVIVRLEQYYPFPIEGVARQLKRYPNAEIFWCQEEPKNMGAWLTIRADFEDALEELGRAPLVRYVGRDAAASPAVGYLKVHEMQQAKLVEEALNVGGAAKKKPAAKSAKKTTKKKAS